MNLNELAASIYEQNKAKGFWDKPRNTGELLMLVVSELGEALEADRKQKHAALLGLELSDGEFKENFELFVKDTFEDEIADAIIRLLDLCGAAKIDIQSHIELKLKYNKTRPHKHGKLY